MSPFAIGPCFSLAHRWAFLLISIAWTRQVWRQPKHVDEYAAPIADYIYRLYRSYRRITLRWMSIVIRPSGTLDLPGNTHTAHLPQVCLPVAVALRHCFCGWHHGVTVSDGFCNSTTIYVMLGAAERDTQYCWPLYETIRQFPLIYASKCTCSGFSNSTVYCSW